MNFARWKWAFVGLTAYLAILTAVGIRQGLWFMVALCGVLALVAAFSAGDANAAARWTPLLVQAIRTIEAASVLLKASNEALAKDAERQEVRK